MTITLQHLFNSNINVMSKKHFIAVLMMFSLPFFNLHVCSAPAPVGLEIGYEDPEHNGGSPHKGPVLVPELSIEDYNLTFTTPCYGYTLELLDEDGDVVYTINFGAELEIENINP